ncbi:MAG: sigma factor-like helix-turn-helix DNA-binding protein [Myxococcota bacterium]
MGRETGSSGKPTEERGDAPSDPWYADSSLPASDVLSELPEEAEPEPDPFEAHESEGEETAEGDEVPTEVPALSGELDESKRRSKTIPRKQMLRDRRRMLAEGSLPEILEYDRPMNRSDCRHSERPCLYVSCRYHLYLDVNPNTGSIKVNFPDREVWELPETCALDVAERGGVTLEEVGEIMNLTRERIRQVEVTGLEKLKVGDASLETFLDGRELPISRLPVLNNRT